MSWSIRCVALVATGAAIGATKGCGDVVARAESEPGPPPAERAGFDCDKPEPPTADYDYELGFADASVPDSDERATRAATDQLRRRLCGERIDCTGLLAGVKRWHAGMLRGRRCVMVTVLKSHQREWLARTASVEPLDAAIREGARRLFERVGQQHRASRGAPKQAPSAVVGAIEDAGTIGGRRALWVASRVEQAMSEAGFRLLDLDTRSGGRRAGGLYDVMITGRMFERSEGRFDILEVALRATSGNERIPLRPAWCGLDALRSEGRLDRDRSLGRRSVPFADLGLTLEIDAGRGGRLCEGDRTQIRLTSDKALHVRVFNIFTRDAGMVIFPNEAVPDDRVMPGMSLALGGESEFEVIRHPGSEEERFIVLASERPEGLGPWRGLSGTCRLGPEVVQRLLDIEVSQLPEGVRAVEAGFRIAREGCAIPPPGEDARRGLLVALSSVPSCPAMTPHP